MTKFRLWAKRVPIRFLKKGFRKNALMVHYIGPDDRPLCGAVINPLRWADVPTGEVEDYEYCRNCLREVRKLEQEC